MRKLLVILSALFLGSSVAPAADLPALPEMVIMPRALVEMVAQWMAQPDPTKAVMIFTLLNACLADNPHGGAIIRMGPDQCPTVTAEIEAQTKLRIQAAGIHPSQDFWK